MRKPFKIGDQVEVLVERLAFQGHGIAKPQNFTLFVPRSAPGDKLNVKITDIKKNHGHASVEQILTPSSNRIDAPCPYFSRCGGCHYQHIEATSVEQEKLQQIKDTFERHGPGAIPMLPIMKTDQEWNYRNRVTYRRDKTGAQGYTAWDNYETLEIDNCLIAEDELNVGWRWVKERIAHISPKVLSFVFVRKIADKIAFTFSVTKDFSTKELRQIFTDHPENYLFYTTVIQESTRTALGKKIEPVFGEAIYLEEKIGDVFYILRPDLFFQVNTGIATLLVEKIVSEFSKSKEPAIDIYCGSGLFTIALAKQGIPMLGIEIQAEAIKSAEQSAIRNNVDATTRFQSGVATTMLERLLKRKESFTRAIVDPPRDGLEPKVIELIPQLGVQELYYVSCSPPTLARDLKEFVKLGYAIEYCQPIEMFPQTYHVETLTKLVKVSG
jgi:23S rRNA (uracil1939-C5)-methyltransferase